MRVLMVPSRYAAIEELMGIGSALGAVSAGAFGMNSDFDDEEEEIAWITRLARETGRPVWFLLTDRYEDAERWRRLLGAVQAARAQGLPVTAQIAGRPIGVMMGIGTALNPFSVRPSYRQLDGLSIPQQRERLRDPALRRRILSETPPAEEIARLAQFRQLITTRWDKFFVMRRSSPPVRLTSGHCRDASSAYRSMRADVPHIDSLCRPASSTSGARRRPQTSALRRCCPPSLRRCTRSTTAPRV